MNSFERTGQKQSGLLVFVHQDKVVWFKCTLNGPPGGAKGPEKNVKKKIQCMTLFPEQD